MATTEHQQALTAVYRSSNRGKSWQNTAEIQGQFWSNLFYHRDALYISGSSLNNHFFELFSTGMGLGPKLVSLIYVLLYVGITFIPAFILYRRKIFIKL